MTLNGIMALFCVISANSGSFRGALRKSSRSLSHLLMSSCCFTSAHNMEQFATRSSTYIFKQKPKTHLFDQQRTRNTASLWRFCDSGATIQMRSLDCLFICMTWRHTVSEVYELAYKWVRYLKSEYS